MPSPTGSPYPAKTIGIVVVAFLAASVAALLSATITSGLRRTSSLAISESRPSLPCAERYSI